MFDNFGQKKVRNMTNKPIMPEESRAYIDLLQTFLIIDSRHLLTPPLRTSSTKASGAFWTPSWTAKRPRSSLSICSYHSWSRPCTRPSTAMARPSARWPRLAATRRAPPWRHTTEVIPGSGSNPETLPSGKHSQLNAHFVGLMFVFFVFASTQGPSPTWTTSSICRRHSLRRNRSGTASWKGFTASRTSCSPLGAIWATIAEAVGIGRARVVGLGFLLILLLALWRCRSKSSLRILRTSYLVKLSNQAFSLNNTVGQNSIQSAIWCWIRFMISILLVLSHCASTVIRKESQATQHPFVI